MSDLPLKQPGDVVTANEWNALVRRAHWEQRFFDTPGTRLAWATTTAAWNEYTETHQVSSIEPLNGDVWNGGDTLEVANTQGLFADNSGKCLIVYNAVNDEWHVILTFTTQSVLTNIRVDGLTLQTKSRPLAGLWVGSESEWTTVHTGTECE